MQLVPITTKDTDILRDIAIRTYTAAFKEKNQPGVLDRYYESAFTSAHLLQQLSDANSYWYFAKDNDILLGYLKLNIHQAQTEFKESQGLEIERIYVDTPYLGKGIGSKLIDFTVSKARELEKSYIWLGVWEKNLKAIQFYKRQGFEVTGTHDYDMIAEIQTDYIMRRNL